MSLATPELPGNSAVDKIMALLGQYKSAAEIPEEVLVANGLAVVNRADGALAITTKERARLLKTQEVVSTVTEKIPPFTTLEVAALGISTTIQDIPPVMTETHVVGRLEQLSFIAEKGIPHYTQQAELADNSAYWHFQLSFSKFLQVSMPIMFGEVDVDKVINTVFIHAFVKPFRDANPLDDAIFRRLTGNMQGDPGRRIVGIPARNCIPLYDLLENYRKILVDPRASKQSIDDLCARSGIEVIKYTTGRYAPPRLSSVMHGKRLTSFFDLLKFSLSEYLQMNKMGYAADALNGCNVFSECKQALLQDSSTSKLLEEYDRKNGVNRLSGQRADVKNTSQAKILAGLRTFFGMSELACAFFDTRFKEIQSTLVPAGIKENRFQLVLDATVNLEADANSGRRLRGYVADEIPPFKEVSVPVFNVKLFDRRTYVGSIFLLVTTNERNQPVWHLDFFGECNARIEWRTTASMIIDELEKQAKTQGVVAITVNTSPHLISHNEAIQEALLSRVKQPEMVSQIAIPDVSVFQGTYSNFQCDNGHVLVIAEPTLSA